MERILLDQHFQDHSTTTDLENALGNHAEDFNLRKLSAQIIMLRSLSETPFDSVTSVAECLLKESSGVRAMLSEVVKLVQLIITLPPSVASAERSFSVLRRIKTYLRSQMKESRLTHLMLLNIHREDSRRLHLSEVCKEFVSRNAERRNVFGSFE